jgi:uncharacterized membrane protein
VRTRHHCLEAPVTASRRRQWLVPFGLIVLSLIPVAAGAARLGQLAGGAAVTPDNARFVAVPAPVVVHIVSATIFCLIGAFQFVPSLRRNAWHRRAGRLLVPFGLAAAVSGLWMAVYYDLPAHDNALLEAFRLLFGTLMIASLVLGVTSIMRRDVVQHRVWMMRGYAIGIGAGTQAVLILPWVLAFGNPIPTVRALLMGAAWVINLAVVEFVVRRGTPHASAEQLMRPAAESLR